MLLLVSRSAITSADEVESKGKIDRDERKKEKDIQKVTITKALRFLPFLQRHTHYRDSLDTVHKHKGLRLGYALPWKVLPTRTPHGFQVARANGE
ncbi:hypothetical protein V1478_010985 [Vespula squamosa]|uniref:Uncharacterized protein n=1 Tax=Vespula squamosa TaxID=30214 RepID=A0ABD2AFW9_VESSQ